MEVLEESVLFSMRIVSRVLLEHWSFQSQIHNIKILSSLNYKFPPQLNITTRINLYKLHAYPQYTAQSQFIIENELFCFRNVFFYVIYSLYVSQISLFQQLISAFANYLRLLLHMTTAIKSPMIQSTKDVICNYSINVSLTKQKLIEVQRTLNQLKIIELIYEAEDEQVKKFIENEMLTLQKRVMESTQASSGLFSRFMGRQSGKSPVSLTDVWVKLSENKGVKQYKNLIEVVSCLKRRQDNKT